MWLVLLLLLLGGPAAAEDRWPSTITDFYGSSAHLDTLDGGGALIMDPAYLFPNARGGVRDTNSAPCNDDPAAASQQEGICPNSESAGVVTTDATFGGEFARITISGASYSNADRTVGPQLISTGGGETTELLSERTCRRTTAPFQSCGDSAESGGVCGTTLDAAGQSRMPLVYLDASTDTYRPMVAWASNRCATASESEILVDRMAPGVEPVTGDFADSMWGDSIHYQHYGDVLVGQFVADAKWEFNWYPHDANNLLTNGRAESNCATSGGWTAVDGGSGGALTLNQRTIDFVNASTNRAFHGTSCEMTGRNEDDDVLRIGTMDGLQSQYDSAEFGDRRAEMTEYYACHGILSCQGGEAATTFRMRVVDADVGTAHTFLATEGTAPTVGTNHYRVWYHNGADFVYATNNAGVAEVPECSTKRRHGAGSLDLGLQQPVVVTFEVEPCDSVYTTNCGLNNTGEQFHLQVDTTGNAANMPSSLWADEWFCYRKPHDDLDLHDVFPNVVQMLYHGDSMSVEVSEDCTQQDIEDGLCGSIVYGIYHRTTDRGKSVTGPRVAATRSIPGRRIWDEFIYGGAPGSGGSTVPFRFQHPDNRMYHFFAMYANDILGTHTTSFTVAQVAANLNKVRRFHQGRGSTFVWIPYTLGEGDSGKTCPGSGINCARAADQVITTIINGGAVIGGGP